MLNEGLNVLSKEMKGVIGIFILFIIILVGYYLLKRSGLE
jgi:hypothetical protein